MYRIWQGISTQKRLKEPMFYHNPILQIMLAAAFLIGMIYMSFHNYLLFHSLIELFSIIIAFMMFAIAINTGRFVGPQSRLLSLLGISYGLVGVFDLLHTLAFKGMGVFPVSTANLPTELWIASRYFLAVSLLMTSIFIDKQVKAKWILLFYFSAAVFLFASIFIFDIFPDCYIEGYGLTDFKKASEVIISAILCVAAILFYLKRKTQKAKTFWLLMISLFFTILSEIVFIFYIDVYGLSNMIGHIAKLISFYLIYKAIVEVNLLNPIIELTRSEQKYADLVESLPEAILISGDEEIAFANTAAIRLFGSNRLQVGLDDLLSDGSQGSQVDQATILEKRIIRPDGSIAHVEIRKLPFVHQDKQSTMTIIYDVTERKSAEQVARRNAELQIEAEILRKADRNKNEFINSLSHELRNPLAAIVAGLSLMELSDDKLKINKAKEIIQRQVNQLCRLVDDLLDVTRIANNKIVLKKERIDLASLVAAVVEDHRLLLARKGINIETILEQQPIFLAADPVRLKQIVGNLLQNAAKFTDQGGNVEVTVSVDNQDAIIRVKDNGIGMKPEFLLTLFEPFKQAKTSLDRSEGGLGLGLSIVKGIAELHGGCVRAFSEGPGKGSELVIRLPI